MSMKRYLIVYLATVLLVMGTSCDNPTETEETYDFTFTTQSDTFKDIQPGETAKFYFHLKNTGSTEDVFELRAVPNYPDTSWVTYVCCQDLCLKDTIVTDTLANGEIDSNVSVYIESGKYSPGVGTVIFRVTSIGDPSKFMEYRVKARAYNYKPDD
jgi:hypothetical protein